MEKIRNACIFRRLKRPDISLVQHEENPGSPNSNHNDVRAVAKSSLLQILDPLAGFVSDLGFSASELQAIFREAVVRCAAAKQLEDLSRINISGIAATTGIPRGEISRILKTKTAAAAQGSKANEGHQQSTNRILAAWHEDPRFTQPNGRPTDLPLYGRGITFEALAMQYGRGIPTRAVFDELLKVGAIELLSTQKIRAKAHITVERGMSLQVIKAFGDRASELLSTMLLNMRKPDSPKFVASVSATGVSTNSLPLLRKELASKGADFLADVKDSFTKKPYARNSKRRDQSSTRVNVTVFYHEAPSKDTKTAAINRRRNFRRDI